MSICSRCGALFSCGAAQVEHTGLPCWCMQLPALSSEAILHVRQKGEQCLCPNCLAEFLPTGAAMTHSRTRHAKQAASGASDPSTTPTSRPGAESKTD